MKTLRRNACLQEHAYAFSLYPTVEEDDPCRGVNVEIEGIREK